VHGSYSTSFLLRALTRWGDKSLAVSSDLKQYLMHNYKLHDRDVFLTVNGINTDTFYPDKSVGERVRKEFGIESQQPVILSVSRLDPDASGGLWRLLHEAPSIHTARPDARLVVVGGGSESNEIELRVDKLNAEGRHPYIIMTGMRRDTQALNNAADVVVGVSRSALEACACSRPVVLAGTAGYLGTLNASTLQSAQLTNFTCRGYSYPEGTPIADAVLALLRDDSQCQKLGKMGMNLVADQYSVRRMTQDALDCYAAAKNGAKGARYDFLLCGYYGYGNAGDEMLLRAISSSLQKKDDNLSICVLNRSSKQASCDARLALVNRFSPFGVISAMKRSSVFVFGGGNLLQDVTSFKSLIYYLALLVAAKAVGCKTMLYGNGVGPIESKLGRHATMSVLSKVDRITLREPDSHTILQSLGLKDDRSIVTADEVFTLIRGSFERRNDLPKNDFIAISLRDWGKRDGQFISTIVAALKAVAGESGLPLLFVPFQPDADKQICMQVAEQLGEEAEVYSGDTGGVLSAITNARIVVGMRLHALVFATAACVPCVGIVYDEKVRAFIDHAGIGEAVTAAPLDGKLLTQSVLLRLANWEKSAHEASLASERQVQLAALNSEVAHELLVQVRGGMRNEL